MVVGPSVVQNYNMKMNGVDKSDESRTEYPTFPMCKRWWTYIFYFLLDLAITNAFILSEAPASNRTFVTSVYPITAALCRGVMP
jgi:hypothetical protein